MAKKKPIAFVGLAALVATSLTGCGGLFAKSYSIEDCIPIMQQYSELDESTSHFMCGNLMHQVGQDEFNKEVAQMKDLAAQGHTMQQDMSDSVNKYFGDLGIDSNFGSSN